MSTRRRIAEGELEAGDVAALRQLVQLSQPQFAKALGISLGTLRNWEQGRTEPQGSGLALLRLVARYPRALRMNISRAR